ncbi:hypothetical protein EV646_109345 [Kribbella antiqua]|uniref:Uncharacterized protein n=1 Tax=Kribbella antiqua TaxID=2512217 RepID=A0A4V2S3N7_9ACTN|nr:hypothetical protein [Kribbella antiqua]TCO45170.1 hypothetical protein EV646_109345 [Kribbella antiqua]
MPALGAGREPVLPASSVARSRLQSTRIFYASLYWRAKGSGYEVLMALLIRSTCCRGLSASPPWIVASMLQPGPELHQVYAGQTLYLAPTR